VHGTAALVHRTAALVVKSFANLTRKSMKLSRSIFSLLLTACFILSACGNNLPLPPTETKIPKTELPIPPTSGTEITPIDLQAGYGVRGPWFELYFTNPVSPISSQGTGGVDGPLVEAIDAARLSIDVAAYSISLNSVRAALIRAHDRGATVRVVMESTNMDRSDPQRMIEAGIPMVGDNRDGLMHDKFVVIDKSEVWMGSMNFTDSGAYDDNNNLMRIRSTKMAENYIKEFEEMFVDNKFGEKWSRNAQPYCDNRWHTPGYLFLTRRWRAQCACAFVGERAEKYFLSGVFLYLKSIGCHRPRKGKSRVNDCRGDG
jgi:phosphatidylserine/phosphatidylglycerophosphate/cardiolipin synthase-like enzyme